MAHITDAFDAILRDGRLKVHETIDIAPRAERRLALPDVLLSSRTGQHLMSTVASDGQAWNHQSLALSASLAGEDVAVTTATASGKSMIFQAAGTHLVETSGNSTVVVFYPVKALTADQMPGWRRMLAGAGLTPDLVTEITGAVPYHERFGLLEKARVAVMTPDVAHAWLLSNLDHPVLRRFVGNLDLVILDEAHVLESVFGSSTAFMLRRLESARRLAGARMRRAGTFRFIAASATVAEPVRHLRLLTGRDFTVVGEDQDGSPSHGRKVVHVTMPPGNEEDESLSAIQASLLDDSGTGSFVTFVDSRKGAERLALGHERGQVSAYRSGYEHKDRAAIENGLRSGSLRGVVSTSALEMGIDFPGLALGINVGVPPSKRSLRQRLGRVGRAAAGTFAVLCDEDAFSSYGEKFADYVSGPVEPCSLYLDNRYLQFAHAKCLHAELKAVGVLGKAALPTGVDWPNGFAEAFEQARPGAPVPAGFETIASHGKGKPHHGYPLRDIADRDFRIGINADWTIGNIGMRSALIEAYPGSVYLHMGRAYEVVSWGKSLSGKHEIKVIPTSSRRSTKPLMRTYANFALDDAGVVDGRILAGGDSFVAETRLRIVEKVEGYVEGDKVVNYAVTSRANPNRSAKSRVFDTTGIVIRTGQSLGGAAWDRMGLARVLVEKLRRSEAASGNDIGIAVSDVTMEMDGVFARLDDAIVVYDKTYGSLRLTEPLFDRFASFVGDLARGHAGTPMGEWLDRLMDWHDDAFPVAQGRVRDAAIAALDFDAAPIDVVAAGGTVSFDGNPWTVISPLVAGLKGKGVLAYRLKDPETGKTAIVAMSKVETAEDGDLVTWCPRTNAIEETLRYAPAAA